MFSRADADQLRLDLKPMQFQGESMSSPILERYRSHYGLNFSTPNLPVNYRIGTLHIASGRSGESVDTRQSELSLACQYFGMPDSFQRGTVFLLHGYFDHTGLFIRLIRHCLEMGLSVVIFDLPGHGLSDGEPASIDSFRRYVAALEECLRQAEAQQLPQPWYSIGQSTGAAVLMDAMLSEELPFSRTILLAPLLRPLGWAQTRVLFALTRLFLKSTPRRFSDNSHDQEFLAFLRHSDVFQSQVIPRDWVNAMIDFQKRFARANPSNSCLHIIQGTGDGTVDWRYNLQKIQDKFPASKVFMVTGARHHLVNESDEYRERVFGLISESIQADLD